jgi:hypothetical protein
LIVTVGCIPAIRVPHRHDVVDVVIAGVVELTEHIDQLADQVRLMEQRMLFQREQNDLPTAALACGVPSDGRRGCRCGTLCFRLGEQAVLLSHLHSIQGCWPRTKTRNELLGINY